MTDTLARDIVFITLARERSHTHTHTQLKQTKSRLAVEMKFENGGSLLMSVQLASKAIRLVNVCDLCAKTQFELHSSLSIAHCDLAQQSGKN